MVINMLTNSGEEWMDTVRTSKEIKHIRKYQREVTELNITIELKNILEEFKSRIDYTELINELQDKAMELTLTK